MKRVALHAQEHTAHAAVCRALEITRQALWLRSRSQGFPDARYLVGKGASRFFETQALAVWLVANGYEVDWI